MNAGKFSPSFLKIIDDIIKMNTSAKNKLKKIHESLQQYFKDNPQKLANLFFENLIKDCETSKEATEEILFIQDHIHRYYMCIFFDKEFERLLKNLKLIGYSGTKIEEKIKINTNNLHLAIYTMCSMHNLVKYAEWLVLSNRYYFQNKLIKVNGIEDATRAVNFFQENKSIVIVNEVINQKITLSKVSMHQEDDDTFIHLSKSNKEILSMYQ